MTLKDFLFSFMQSLKLEIKKKRYFKFLRKLFNYPYKFFLDKFRELFYIKKYNLDKISEYKILQKMSIDNLFKNFNSDKASRFIISNKEIGGHNYSPFYEKYLLKYKKRQDLKILEIGSLRGAATASFYFYFDKPQIYCADINPFQIRAFSKNIRKFYVDSQSKDSLSNLSQHINQDFDIIIDDGSHNIKDQINTLNAFFRKLKSGGLYVIEDTTQYLADKDLNMDNLSYGAKEIILSVKKGETIKKNYTSIEEAKILSSGIENVFFENGNYIQNNINISEILFLERK